jgi:SSS family solute:Na+ symporter
VALLAGIISAGCVGFTSSSFGWSQISIRMWFKPTNSVMVMGIIAVVYTAIGGLKAVIYTDTIQWLIFGLVFIGIPMPIMLWEDMT